jgi:hypothetical protein
MAVPERDVVDQCFESAKKRIFEITDFDLKAATGAIVAALEGLTHQIRDADDTVATVLASKIEQGFTDLTIARGGESSF